MRRIKRKFPLSANIFIFGLSLLLFLQISQGVDVTEIEVNQNMNLTNKENNKSGKYWYQIKDKTKLNKKRDLIIQFINYENAKVGVYMNSGKQKSVPNSNENPLCVSHELQKYMCTIEGRYLQENIFLYVQCLEDCQYSFNLFHQDTFSYENQEGIGKSLQRFNSYQKKYIKVNVPTNNSVQPRNIVVTAVLKNFQELGIGQRKLILALNPIHLNESNQKEIYQSSNTVKKITANIIPGCLDCFILLEIDAPKNALIELSAQFNSLIEWNLETKIIGAVDTSETVQYKIDFQNLSLSKKKIMFSPIKLKTNLLFSLVQLSGESQLSIEYYNQNNEKYEFINYEKTTQPFFLDHFLLSPEQQQMEILAKGQIIISVKGIGEQSAFELNVNIKSTEERPKKLEYGLPIRSFVSSDSVDNYFLEIGTKLRYISLFLTNEFGQIAVSMKLPQNKSGSSYIEHISSKEILQFQEDPSKSNIEIFKNISNQFESFQRIFNPIDCKAFQEKGNSEQNLNIEEQICVYSIAVQGIGLNNYYEIRVEAQGEVEQLTEHKPVEVDLRENESQYFKFNLDNKVQSQNWHKIRFEVQKIMGFAVMFGDTDPNQLINPIHQNLGKYRNVHFLELKKEDFKSPGDSSYYIRILGIVESKAVIRVSLLQNMIKGDSSVQYTQIEFKKPTQLIIYPNTSNFFQFPSQLDQNHHLYAKSNQKFQMFLGESKDEPPSQYRHTQNADSNFGSTDKIKRINLKKGKFESPIHYGIIINPSLKDTIIVEILLHGESIALHMNQAFEDILMEDTKRIFLVNMFEVVLPLRVYFVSFQYKINENIERIYYLNNKQIGEKRTDYVINIQEFQYLKHCFEGNKRKEKCYLKIVIEPIDYERRFIVSVVSPLLPTYLNYPGQFQQIPFKGTQRLFYYYMDTAKDYLITVIQQFNSIKFKVFGRVIKSAEYFLHHFGYSLSDHEFHKQNQELQIMFDSELSEQHYIKIRKEMFKNDICDSGCFLQIYVLSDFNDNESQNKLDFFKISIRDDFIHDLDEVFGLAPILKDGEIDYFRVYIPSTFDSNEENLIVSLTPLKHCDLNFKMLAGYSNKPEFLTTEGNSLKISTTEIFRYPSEKEKLAKGYNVIGVKRTNQCKYIIQQALTKENIQLIQLGKKVDSSASLNKNSYFLLQTKFGKLSITMNFSQKTVDQFSIKVSKYNLSDVETINYINNIHKDTKQIQDVYYDIQQGKHELFLEGVCDCLYLIEVSSEQTTSAQFSLEVKQKENFWYEVIQTHKFNVLNRQILKIIVTTSEYFYICFYKNFGCDHKLEEWDRNVLQKSKLYNINKWYIVNVPETSTELEYGIELTTKEQSEEIEVKISGSNFQIRNEAIEIENGGKKSENENTSTTKKEFPFFIPIIIGMVVLVLAFVAFCLYKRCWVKKQEYEEPQMA